MVSFLAGKYLALRKERYSVLRLLEAHLRQRRILLSLLHGGAQREGPADLLSRAVEGSFPKSPAKVGHVCNLLHEQVLITAFTARLIGMSWP